MTTEAMLRELEAVIEKVQEPPFAVGDDLSALKEQVLGYCQAAQFLRTHGPALVEAVRDAGRLDWLEKEYGSNLVNDDDCRWALSTSGFQPIPDDGGFKEPVSIVSFVEPDEWRNSIREAIDQARAEGGE